MGKRYSGSFEGVVVLGENGVSEVTGEATVVVGKLVYLLLLVGDGVGEGGVIVDNNGFVVGGALVKGILFG